MEAGNSIADNCFSPGEETEELVNGDTERRRIHGNCWQPTFIRKGISILVVRYKCKQQVAFKSYHVFSRSLSISGEPKRELCLFLVKIGLRFRVTVWAWQFAQLLGRGGIIAISTWRKLQLHAPWLYASYIRQVLGLYAKICWAWGSDLGRPMPRSPSRTTSARYLVDVGYNVYSDIIAYLEEWKCKVCVHGVMRFLKLFNCFYWFSNIPAQVWTN